MREPISVDIEFGRRGAASLLSAFLLLYARPLDSEPVTLSFPYPPAQASYQSDDAHPFIVSNNAVLARDGGTVAVGTASPDASVRLDVNGTLRIADGTQGMDKVLTSDANGVASWQSPASPAPPGAVIFLEAAACPGGWSELTSSRGRYPMGVSPGNAAGLTSGVPQGPQESGPGRVGNIGLVWETSGNYYWTRLFYSGVYSCKRYNRQGAWSQVKANDCYMFNNMTSSSWLGTQGLAASNVNSASSRASDRPYVQLLVCQKD